MNNKVKKNDVIKLHCTVKSLEGEVMDSSAGKEPLVVRIGGDGIIKGLNDALMGMSEGEKKSVVIESENAYGIYREGLLFDIPKSNFARDLTPEPGMDIQIEVSDSVNISVTVREVKEDMVTVDANHYLAGRTLVFDVELLEIIESTDIIQTV